MIFSWRLIDITWNPTTCFARMWNPICKIAIYSVIVNVKHVFLFCTFYFVLPFATKNMISTREQDAKHQFADWNTQQQCFITKAILRIAMSNSGIGAKNFLTFYPTFFCLWCFYHFNHFWCVITLNKACLGKDFLLQQY